MSTEPLWMILKDPQGRRYYYNSQFKFTTWDRPEELRDARAVECSWKEFKTPEGKPYFFNKVSLITAWEAPPLYDLHQEYTKLKDQQEDILLAQPPGDPTEINQALEEVMKRADGEDIRFQQMQTASLTPAQKRYWELLCELGVDESWTWERAMSVTLFHHLYHAIPALADRRATFQKYQTEYRRVQDESRERRVEKRRQVVISILRDIPSINAYSVWRKYASTLQETSTLSGFSPEEIRHHFNAYIKSLQREEKAQEEEVRKENVAKFQTLLESLPLGADTTWAEAQEIIGETPLYQADEQLRQGDPRDYLNLFDRHIERLEEEHRVRMRDEREEQDVKERRNREDLRALLHRLRETGEVGAATRWQDAYPLLRDHPAYQEALGQGGSTPQELLWDMVEDAYEPIYQRRKDIEKFFKAQAFRPDPEISFDTFTTHLQPEHFESMSRRDMEMIHEEIQQKARYKARDERQRQDRVQKRRINHL
ncbi:hypothetical protein BJ684DRAFT_21543, partial [Piptocephalis cylindrospora]